MRSLLVLLTLAACRPAPATALEEAAGNNDLSTVRALLEEGPAEPGAALWAARRGATEALLLLVDAGVPVDVQDSRPQFGWTPLILALHGGHPSTALALLARGADPDAAGRDGMTPLVQACGAEDWAGLDAPPGRAALVGRLLAAGARPSSESLLVAAAQGHTETVRALRRADPELALPDTLHSSVVRQLARWRGDAALLAALGEE